MYRTAFFFVSTPQHFLMAASYALAHPDLQSHLLIIDQKQTDNNPIQNMLNQWHEQPFHSNHLFSGHWSGLFNKVKGRKQVFSNIANLIDQHQPNQLFTGSDKRLEFQFAAHYAKQKISGTICSYIDEGTITYNPNHHMLNRFSEKYLGSMLKKLAYGSWWEHPLNYGATSHIDQVLALFPDQVVPRLKEKILIAFDKNWFSNQAMRKLTLSLLTDQSSPGKVKNYNSIFLLPHHSLGKLYPEYLTQLVQMINEASRQNPSKVAVKLHPRNQTSDFNNLESINQLDSKLPFELFLPFLRENVVLLGDMSSTLHVARWMLPQAKLFAINPDPEKNHPFAQLYRNISIEVISLQDVADMS